VKAHGLATAFGGISAAIGAYYMAAPRHFLEQIGARPNRRRVLITRVVAAQELSVGGALFADGRAARWLGARVMGDVLHAAMLALAYRAPDNDRDQMRLAFGALLAIAAADVAGTIAASRIERSGASLENGPGESSAAALAVADTTVQRSVTVNRQPAEVYAFWRGLENLPTFMKHLEAVTVIDERRSHWVARAPLGRTVEWDAEITHDQPGERIGWTSTGGSQVWNAGEVTFAPAPGDRGTEVRVRLDYAPPAGALGATLARLVGDEPASQISGDLRRLKQVLETGEVVLSEAVIEGRSRRQRPAQPVVRAA
jgi:uncharacterized membrane protein